jgi:N-acetylmuramoyl-L-alanine amidase
MAFRIVVHPSPNHSDRGGVEIDTIMLHSTGGALRGSLEWLCNPNSKVSAHYLLSKDGVIYKLVPITRAAWHAGRCRVPNANRRSIGIEMEQLPGDSWTDAQREVLTRLVRVLRHAVPTIKYLVGHREWNSKKIDPYNVDMDELRKRFLLEDLK